MGPDRAEHDGDAGQCRAGSDEFSIHGGLIRHRRQSVEQFVRRQGQELDEVVADDHVVHQARRFGDIGDFREQADLDSMDFMNFVVGLGKDLGLEIPEADFPQLSTLDGCVAYLVVRGPRDGPASLAGTPARDADGA